MAIQALLAKIGVDTKNFDKGMKDSTKKVGGLRSAIKKLGPAFAALGVGKLVKDFVDLAGRMKELSAISGTTVEDFQRVAYAAKQYGVEQDKVADILKDVSDKVGDFLQTGAGPLADFFENIAPQVGVTAEQFRNLSGKEALELYVSSLEKANVSQNEMTFFMEAIASDASLLIPLFSDNAKELNRLGDAAERMGLIMDEDLIESTRNAKNQIETFMMGLTILTGKIISKVVPAFQLLVGSGEQLGAAVVSLTAKFGAYFGFLSDTAMSVINPVAKAFKGLFEMMIAGSKALTNPKAAIEGMKSATDTFKESFDDLKDAPSKVVDAYKRADQEMKDINKQIEAQTRKTTEQMARSWDALWGKTTKGAKETGEAVGKVGTDSGGGGGTPKLSKAQQERIKKEEEARREAIILEKELQALRLKEQGNTAAAEALEREVELLEKANDLMKKFGITGAEAFKLAKSGSQKMLKDEDGSDLEGDALRKAANIAGKEKGISFQRMADGTFQQFVKGKKGARLTEEQLQVGLQKQIDNDGEKTLLEKINKTLEGKFVSQ
jgi:hypothetical protein